MNLMPYYESLYILRSPVNIYIHSILRIFANVWLVSKNHGVSMYLLEIPTLALAQMQVPAHSALLNGFNNCGRWRKCQLFFFFFFPFVLLFRP